MNKHYLITALMMALFAITTTDAAAQGLLGNIFSNGAKKGAIDVVFDNQNHDFGSVTNDALPAYTFRFTNTSDVPIKLSNFDRACNVTIPAYSKEVIEPGEEGYFKVIFNPRDIDGDFAKNMKVIFSYPDSDKQKLSMEEVNLKGNVVSEQLSEL